MQHKEVRRPHSVPPHSDTHRCDTATFSPRAAIAARSYHVGRQRLTNAAQVRAIWHGGCLLQPHQHATFNGGFSVPFLICTFASRRSRPEKIRRWIEYLDQLQQVHADSAERLLTISILRSKAQSWLEA